MPTARRILSNLSVINILLAVTLLLFADYTVLPLFGGSVKITAPAKKMQQPAAHSVPTAATAAKAAEVKSPSPSDYLVIADQNLFHPERKIPVEKKAEVPLPKPDFVLYGTLKTDDLHVAYMEDKKAPQNTPARGKRQIPVRLGEALSGFTLKEISPDSVVMARGEEKLVVFLNDSARPKTREGATVIPVAHTGPASQTQPPFGPRQAQQTQQTQQASQPTSRASSQATAPQPVNTQPPPAAQSPPPAQPRGNGTSVSRDAFYRLFNRR